MMESSIRPRIRLIARVGAVLAGVLAILAVTTGTASAHGEFSNNQTTLITRDDGRYIGTLEVAVWTQNVQASYHVHVWGPGFNLNTKTENVGAFRTYRDYVPLNRAFKDGDRICGEGWRSTGSGYQSMGLPCFTIGSVSL